MLWRRCSNVEATSWKRWRATLSQRRKLTSVQLSFSTVPQRCDNVNNDVVTTLWQRRCASWEDNKIDFFLIGKYSDIAHPEPYSEPSQTSKMELLAKIVNSLKPLTIFPKCSILLRKWNAILGFHIMQSSLKFWRCHCTHIMPGLNCPRRLPLLMVDQGGINFCVSNFWLRVLHQ